jgi:hypothetical protein
MEHRRGNGGGQRSTERRCCEIENDVVSLLGIRQSRDGGGRARRLQRSSDAAEMPIGSDFDKSLCLELSRIGFQFDRGAVCVVSPHLPRGFMSPQRASHSSI